MEINTAKSIASALAHGVNPLTGEELSQDSLYQDLDVIRALFCLLDAVNNHQRPTRPKPKKTLKEKQEDNVAQGRPRNAGLPWTDEMKAALAEKFDGGNPLNELAQYFERSRGAIIAALVKEGLINRQTADEMYRM